MPSKRYLRSLVARHSNHSLSDMRKIFIIVLLLSASSNNGFGQKRMSTIYDGENIKAYTDSFKGKPLAFLLDHIEPEIKAVYVETERDHNAPGYFIFKFIDSEEQKKYNLANKRSLSVLVYVKEKFRWNKQGVEATKWSQNDAEAFGCLTIVRVGVVGESL